MEVDVSPVRRRGPVSPSRHSGGAGAPPGGTRASCQELLTTEALRLSAKARPGDPQKRRSWRAERRPRGPV